MKKKVREKITQTLFGGRTLAKASGLAFSVAAVLPNVLAILVLLGIGAVSALVGGIGDYQTQDWYLYVNYALTQFAFAITAGIFLAYIGKTPKAALQEQKCSWKYFLVAVLLQVGLLSLSELNALFLQFLQRFGYEDAGISLPSMEGFGFVGVLFVVALLPAVFEEIMFRGVLLSGLRGFGKTGAILVCGLLFALYHQNPAQTVYQFCCGAAFALVAIRAGSILPTVLSHFLNNAFILLLYKLGIETFPPVVQWTVIGVSAVCLIFSLGYLLFWDKNEKDKTEENSAGESVEARREFFTFALVGIAVCTLTWVLVLLGGM